MLDMYGQPHQTQPQPAHSSLSQQYHFQQSSASSSSSSNNKKLKLDHVFQQQQAVDLCSLSASVQQHHQLGPSDSVSLYEVSSTTGCGSGASGSSRGSHGISQGRTYSATGYALAAVNSILIIKKK